MSDVPSGPSSPISTHVNGSDTLPIVRSVNIVSVHRTREDPDNNYFQEPWYKGLLVLVIFTFVVLGAWALVLAKSSSNLVTLLAGYWNYSNPLPFPIILLLNFMMYCLLTICIEDNLPLWGQRLVQVVRAANTLYFCALNCLVIF